MGNPVLSSSCRNTLTTAGEPEIRPFTHVALPHGNAHHNVTSFTAVVDALPAFITLLRSFPGLISELGDFWSFAAPVGYPLGAKHSEV